MLEVGDWRSPPDILVSDNNIVALKLLLQISEQMKKYPTGRKSFLPGIFSFVPKFVVLKVRKSLVIL